MQHDLTWFKTNRKEQYQAAKDILHAIYKSSDEGVASPTPIILIAPVKSGKREIVEIINLLIRNQRGSGVGLQIEDTYFLTSLNRTDIKVQFQELAKYGIKFPLNAKHQPSALTDTGVANQVIHEFTTQYADGKLLVILDESDYGTRHKQVLERVYATARQKKFPIVHFSATNEEAVFSKLMKQDGATIISFTPAPTYRGSSAFLAANLVHEAKPFYDTTTGILTNHGVSCMWEFSQDDKAFSVLRLTERGAFNHFAKNDVLHTELATQYGVRVMMIGEKTPFRWGTHGDWERELAIFSHNKTKTLLVINQTCSRSTEIGFHQHISFWHDYRSPATPYNTVLQAILRVAHYAPHIHKIKVYGCVASLEYDANQITRHEYEECTGRKLSNRITRDRIKSDETRKIFTTWESCVDFCTTELQYTPRYKFKQRDGKLLATIRDKTNSTKTIDVLLTLDSLADDHAVYDLDLGGGVNETSRRIRPVWITSTNQQAYILAYSTGSQTIQEGMTTKSSIYSHLTPHDIPTENSI